MSQPTESPPDFAHNEYAERRRTEKALAIVDLLAPMGFTAELVGFLPADSRRTAEKYAGVRLCSDETWARVISIFQNRETAALRAKAFIEADEAAERASTRQDRRTAHRPVTRDRRVRQ